MLVEVLSTLEEGSSSASDPDSASWKLLFNP